MRKIRKIIYVLVAAIIVFTGTAGFLLLSPRTTGYATKQTGENSLGPENAKVIITEFSDFQCPYCGKAEPTIKQILAAYPNDVRLVYKHFPLPFHENSEKAAEASECAAAQDKFWEYHDILFANQNALYVPMLKDYAKQLGLDTDAFNKCLDGGAMKSAVESDMKEGESIGVSGTPAFFVNSRVISGAQPFSVFDNAVKTELNK